MPRPWAPGSDRGAGPHRQPADTASFPRVALGRFSSSHCEARAFITDPHRGLKSLALCILCITVESGIKLPLTLPRFRPLPREAAEASGTATFSDYASADVHGSVSRPVTPEALGERSAEAKVRAQPHCCTPGLRQVLREAQGHKDDRAHGPGGRRPAEARAPRAPALFPSSVFAQVQVNSPPRTPPPLGSGERGGSGGARTPRCPRRGHPPSAPPAVSAGGFLPRR